jgi:hypothetical protein
LPFHPEVGNHTSILMSESGVGASVAAIRQNAGNLEMRLPMGESGGAGYTPTSANFPAGTSWAEVIVVLAGESDDKRSHEAITLGV